MSEAHLVQSLSPAQKRGAIRRRMAQATQPPRFEQAYYPVLDKKFLAEVRAADLVRSLDAQDGSQFVAANILAQLPPEQLDDETLRALRGKIADMLEAVKRDRNGTPQERDDVGHLKSFMAATEKLVPEIEQSI